MGDTIMKRHPRLRLQTFLCAFLAALLANGLTPHCALADENGPTPTPPPDTVANKTTTRSNTQHNVFDLAGAPTPTPPPDTVVNTTTRSNQQHNVFDLVGPPTPTPPPDTVVNTTTRSNTQQNVFNLVGSPTPTAPPGKVNNTTTRSNTQHNGIDPGKGQAGTPSFSWPTPTPTLPRS
jgi:hypothetical protein